MTTNPRRGWTKRIQNSSGITLAGAPIIALHGFTGRGSDWAVLRERMRGHAWLTPDLPGHGPIPALPADLGAHDAVVTRALGFFTEPPVLLGYSMGARAALHIALAHPRDFSALILIGGSPGLDDAGARDARVASDTALASRIHALGTAAFLEEWDAQPLLAGKAAMPEPHRTRAHAARRQNTPAGLAASLAGFGAGVPAALWDRLGELTIPALLITGERDDKFAAIAARMHAREPRLDTASIASAGHAPHLEQPADTAAVIDDWLAHQNGADR